MFSAAFETVKSYLPTPPERPNFDFSLFKPKEELAYIKGNIEEGLPLDKKDILLELLDKLSIKNCPLFFMNSLLTYQLGLKATPIHPFNTFEFFLSTEERIEKTKTIYHKTGVLIGFEIFKTQSIQGFACFLKERHEKGELIDNLDEFCKKTRKDKTLLKSLIDAGDFDKLVEEVLVNV